MMLEAADQLMLVACAFAVVALALVLGESVRVLYWRWHDEQVERGACERIDQQQRVGRYERIARDVIEQRRR